MNEYLLYCIFFFIALFYSSIGFGGGSSYLAVLSLVMTNFYEIRTLALVLNVLVVTIGTMVFLRSRVFKRALFFPFLVLSVPMAFLGTQLRLSETYFFVTLGLALVVAALAMLAQSFAPSYHVKLSSGSSASLGGIIGLLSGMVGIGGGIFLSPTLNLMKWNNAVTIASLASFFILVNSLAGILGLILTDTFQLNASFASGIIASVGLGGLVGSQLVVRMNLSVVRTLTAMLVLYVGVRLVFIHGFDKVIGQ